MGIQRVYIQDEGGEIMLEIVICDKLSEYLEIIAQYVEKIVKPLTEYCCRKTIDSSEVLKLDKEIKIDLLLIEVELSGLSGFEIVKRLRKVNKKMLVIFISNKDLYVYESFKYQPFRFIRKSHMEELDEALLSAVFQIKFKRKNFSFRLNTSQSASIKAEDIIYFESLHNYVKLVSLNQEYRFRSTLKDIENELEKYGFVRIHSGYLLNIRYIYLIRKNEVEICLKDNQIFLPLSRSKRQNLINIYNKSYVNAG